MLPSTNYPTTPIPNKKGLSPNEKKVIAVVIAIPILIIAATVVISTHVTPKLRFRPLKIDKIVVKSKNPPSFSLRLYGEIRVKNPNFVPFKFASSTISIVYRGNVVGSAYIPRGVARARSAKKVYVEVRVVVDGGVLGGDFKSGKIALTSHATFTGKIITKKKIATMDCNMDVNIRTRPVDNLQCY